MNKIIYLVILFAIFTACDSASQYTDKNYPTILDDLTNEQLDVLYDRAYNIGLYGCTAFDYQGRLIQYLNDELCERNDSTPANFTRLEMVQMVKQTVAQNEMIFGVADTSELELTSVRSNTGIRYENYFTADTIIAPEYWRLVFDRQKIENIEVFGTQLQFIIDADGIVSASGKWYQNIYIPETDIISELDAQESLYGLELVYDRTRFTPQENSTWFAAKRIIFPVYQSGQLIFHVCWAIHPESWEVIIDTQDGQILSTVNIDQL